MSNINYGLTEEEIKSLQINTNDALSTIKDGRITPQDMVEVLRLLEVNEQNFESYKAEAWFKKAWFIISGKRGKLTDITINNIGKIQIGVIRILDQIINDSSKIKDDILYILSNIKKIKTESRELRYIILSFNKSHKENFKKLLGEIRKTRWLLQITQILTGCAFIVGAILQYLPGLSGQYWLMGLISWGVAGISLIILSFVGFNKRTKVKSAIPVNKRKIFLPENVNDELSQRVIPFIGANENIDNRIFKARKEIKDLIDYFCLNVEEQKLLFSLEYYITNVDVERTADRKTQKKKSLWLKNWRKMIESQLRMPIVRKTNKLFFGLEEIREENIALPKLGIILLETMIFEPYFPLDTKKDKKEKLKYDENNHKERIEELCNTLGFNNKLLDDANVFYEQGLKHIPPSTFWRNLTIVLATVAIVTITGGLAASAIGGIIGGIMGLSGAAGVSAGLAFLGGGAIAAGGFGVTGGTVALIGGGAIIGAGIGSGTTKLIELFSNSKELMLRELSKLEAASKAFFNKLPNSKDVIISVIAKEKTMRNQMDNKASEIRRKKTKTKEDKRTMKELEGSIELCNRAIKRLDEFVKACVVL